MILWAFTEHAAQRRKLATGRAHRSRADSSLPAAFAPRDWARLWAVMEPVALWHAHAFTQQVGAPLQPLNASTPPPPPPVRRAYAAYAEYPSAERCCCW
jgi:hypothetical protein